MDVLHSFLSAPHPTEGVKDALRSCVDRDLVARVEETARTTGKVVLQMAAVRRLAQLSTAHCPDCDRDREVDSAGNFKVHLLRDGDVGAGACPGSRQPASGLVAAEPVAKVAPAEKPAPAPAPTPEPVMPPVAAPGVPPPPALPGNLQHARALRLGALESVLQRAGWTELARAVWWAAVEGRESFLDGDPGEALVCAGVLKTAPKGADLPDLWRDSLLAWAEEHVAVALAGADVAVLALCEAVDAAGPTDVAALVALSKRAAALDGPVADALARWVARVSPPPAPSSESGPINRAWEQRVSQMTAAPELLRELDRAYGLLSPRQQDMVDRVKVDPSHWGILRREVDVSGLGTDPCSRRGKGDTLSAALEDDRPLLLTLLVREKASAALRGEAPDTKTIAAIEKAHAALMAGERLRVLKPAWTATDHAATCQCGRSVGLLRRRDEALVYGLHAGDSGAACRWSLTPHYPEQEREPDPDTHPMQCPIPSCRAEVAAAWDGERLMMPRHINATHLGACPMTDVPQQHWPESLVSRLAPSYAVATGGDLPPQECPECWSVGVPARLWRSDEGVICYAPHPLADGEMCPMVAGTPVQEDEMDEAAICDVDEAEQAHEEPVGEVTLPAYQPDQPPPEIVELARTIAPRHFEGTGHYTRGEVMTFRQAWELGVSEAVALGACVLPGGKVMKPGDSPEPAYNFPMDGTEPHAEMWVLEMVPEAGSRGAEYHRCRREVESMTENIPTTITPGQAAAYLARMSAEEQAALVQRLVREVTGFHAEEEWGREWDACDADMRLGLSNSVPFVPLLEEFNPPSDVGLAQALRAAGDIAADMGRVTLAGLLEGLEEHGEVLAQSLRFYQQQHFSPKNGQAAVSSEHLSALSRLNAYADEMSKHSHCLSKNGKEALSAMESVIRECEDVREMLEDRGYLLPGDERPLLVALTAALDGPTDEDGVPLSEYRDMVVTIEDYLTSAGELGDNEERLTSQVVIDLLKSLHLRHYEMAKAMGAALDRADRADRDRASQGQPADRHPARVVEVGGNPPTAILRVECDVATAQRFGRLLYQSVEVCVLEEG